MESRVAVVAKEFEDAVDILKDLQKENIIDYFDEDEDSVEPFSKETIERGRKKINIPGFFSADAVYVNDAFEDDEDIVDGIMDKIEMMMQPDETVWYFDYE